MTISFLWTLFTVTICFGATQEIECPNGWTVFEESCYFLAEEVSVDWIEAAHYCTIHKGHLVKVDSQAEDTFLQHECKRLIANATKDSDSFWLGATDDILEGIWLWYVDDSEMEYVNWNSGQPDSAGGSNQDCLCLHGTHEFRWHDIECDKKYHPICEINMDEEGIIG